VSYTANAPSALNGDRDAQDTPGFESEEQRTPEGLHQGVAANGVPSAGQLGHLRSPLRQRMNNN